jgi:hypothetical protein
VLQKHAGVPARIFVVWEPILAMDLAPPISAVLGRIPDVRVQQYWDPNHLVAKRMAADARAPQPEPECCTQNGVLWDLVAAYPKGALWTDRMPPATLFNGPILDLDLNPFLDPL